MPVDYSPLAASYDTRYDVNPLAGIGHALNGLAARIDAASILEVGCGTGRWLATVAAPGRTVCGVDPSLAMLARAAAKGSAVAAARAADLPFPPATFDLVFAVNAIHHFGDAAGFIHSASGLLRAGGALAIVTIDPRLIRARYFYQFFDGTLERDLERHPSLGDLVNAMASAGLARIQMEVAESASRSFRGAAVLADPFLTSGTNSLFSLLSEEEYRRGLERIRSVVESRPDAEFLEELDFYIVTGFN